MNDISKYIVGPETNIVEAMQRIDSGAKGIVFVCDNDNKLIGSITDGDIRRWLVKTAELKATVDMFMTTSPKYISAEDIERATEYMNKHSINALPVCNENMVITDIVFRDFAINKSVRKSSDLLNGVPVVIMAGGKGTRLYPYTMVMPKPLIPIGETTIIERILDQFYNEGAKDFYLTVNYKKNMIKAYFEELETPYRIHYVDETKPLGTGGSLSLIQTPFEQPFIVTNCDTLIQSDLAEIYKAHCASDNCLTVVSATKNFAVPYGVLKVKEGCVLEGLQEKPKLSYFINTGMYVLSPELMNEIPRDTFYNMTDLIDSCLKKGMKVGVYPISEDNFLDMGEFKEMKRMEERLYNK